MELVYKAFLDTPVMFVCVAVFALFILWAIWRIANANLRYVWFAIALRRRGFRVLKWWDRTYGTRLDGVDVAVHHRFGWAHREVPRAPPWDHGWTVTAPSPHAGVAPFTIDLERPIGKIEFDGAAARIELGRQWRLKYVLLAARLAAEVARRADEGATMELRALGDGSLPAARLVADSTTAPAGRSAPRRMDGEH